MHPKKSTKIYEAVSTALGGPEKSAFLLLVFDQEGGCKPSIITDIPEEYLKRVIRKLGASIEREECVEVVVGDEIAFRLEATPPKTNQDN